jgi:hypothetical protein
MEIVDEYVCNNECETTDDIEDGDVAEDEKEEVNEPLDLFDSYVQGICAALCVEPWQAAAEKGKKIK